MAGGFCQVGWPEPKSVSLGSPAGFGNTQNSAANLECGCWTWWLSWRTSAFQGQSRMGISLSWFHQTQTKILEADRGPGHLTAPIFQRLKQIAGFKTWPTSVAALYWIFCPSGFRLFFWIFFFLPSEKHLLYLKINTNKETSHAALIREFARLSWNYPFFFPIKYKAGKFQKNCHKSFPWPSCFTQKNLQIK